MQRWWHTLFDKVDATALLADHGFAARSALISEFSERLRLKLLPATPETADASMLFSLVLIDAFDARWIPAPDGVLLMRVAERLQDEPAGEHETKTQLSALSTWQTNVMEAITFCMRQIRATGFSPELRLRMSAPAREAVPFHALAADLEALHRAFPSSDAHAIAERQKALDNFVKQLDACHRAAVSAYTHLDAHGISVNLVLQLRQLREWVLRIRALLDCLFSSDRQAHTAKLMAHLVTVGLERRSLSALIASNSSMLATKVAERSSETGERYITRTMPEYRAMLLTVAP